MGEQMFMSERETKWCVVVAAQAMEPYTKSEYNPVSNNGHKTLLWKYNNGIVALLYTDGMERNTIQYSKDDITFEIMGNIKKATEAAGPFRIAEKDMNSPLYLLKCRLSHTVNCD